MATECPHCYRTVFPLATGECPACHRNVRDRTGVDPDRVTVVVSEKSALPEVCCRCAGLTRRMVRVTSSLKSVDPTRASVFEDEEDLATGVVTRLFFGRRLVNLFWNLGSITAALLPGSQASQAGVSIRMTFCPECAKQWTLQPVFIDHDYCKMKFVVHRRFAEHFQQLNPKRQ